MTQEYKVGDDVLVRMRISEIGRYENFLVKAVGDGAEWWVARNKIYSPAPPFDIGEQVLVSDDNFYSTPQVDTFRAYAEGKDFPFICSEHHWKHARKIPPKDEPVTVTLDQLKEFLEVASGRSDVAEKLYDLLKGRRFE